jgi:hypothetical protein
VARQRTLQVVASVPRGDNDRNPVLAHHGRVPDSWRYVFLRRSKGTTSSLPPSPLPLPPTPRRPSRLAAPQRSGMGATPRGRRAP